MIEGVREDAESRAFLLPGRQGASASSLSCAAALGLGVALTTLLSACIVTRHPAAIAGSSSPMTMDFAEIGAVERDSCASWILGIPLGSRDDTHVMIQELIKEKAADALVGVTVEDSSHTFALPLFGSRCTTVKGRAVRGGK